jgi:queuine tRNA-ribosyltransferase
MRAEGFGFELLAVDPSGARRGRLTTPHGVVETPAFMPVGTQATVKSLAPRNLEETGARIILANTYHLYLRPGHELIRDLGGLHRFMAWPGPILTDSGGYQVFSLGPLRTITEEGARFRSHLDGSSHLLTPERAVAIQEALGADVIMAFDECAPYPASRDYTERSTDLTTRWAKRCADAKARPDQALFGIVQGGMFPDLRRRSAEAIRAIGFDGYAIGGVSVGEPRETMFEIVAATAPALPADRPRYLMGVGTPADILAAIGLGVDLFDCVLPTRNARNGSLFVAGGKINIRNARYARDAAPVEEGCDCHACRTFSRAYLRHLAVAGEMLSGHLNTIHNLRHYARLVEGARTSIARGEFLEYSRALRSAEAPR